MIVSQKPQVFIRKITFNDDTVLPLEKNSIIVFTGANNCGKSQVLKDVETFLKQSNRNPPIVIRNIEPDFVGDIGEHDFFNAHFLGSPQGFYQILGTGMALNKKDIVSNWNKHSLTNGLHTCFIKRLSTEFRLTSSNSLTKSEKYPEAHPIGKLLKSESLAQEISDYFCQAFNVDLVINRNDPKSIHLHVGTGPDKTKYNMAMQDEYYELVSKLPKLQEEGDGMRSFAGILLDTFTSEYSITLIDEPEAFLHPPQARILGKMLAKNNPTDRQLLIATHSEDFLQGILDADTERVTVIRINREDTINRMSVLHNDEIKKLWSNPILRYSNILSGLFHEKVVVCESDYDCLFYQALINALSEQRGDISPDILFVHCGGKSRIKDVVKALKAVNVPVRAICDFDILNNKTVFRQITDSFFIDWDSALSQQMDIFYQVMNTRNSTEKDTWERAKRNGKTELSGEAPAAYAQVEMECKSAGLFIVPVGEMECFDKTINKQKKEWVYYILENYVLTKEPKLNDARNFILDIISVC